MEYQLIKRSSTTFNDNQIEVGFYRSGVHCQIRNVETGQVLLDNATLRSNWVLGCAEGSDRICTKLEVEQSSSLMCRRIVWDAISAEDFPEVKPRNWLHDEQTLGEFESDRDYVFENLKAAAWLLDNAHKLTWKS